MPKRLKNIGYAAFRDCVLLSSIHIPKDVMTMGDYVFEGCDMLTIYCEAEEEPKAWGLCWNYNCPVFWGYEKEK